MNLNNQAQSLSWAVYIALYILNTVSHRTNAKWFSKIVNQILSCTECVGGRNKRVDLISLFGNKVNSTLSLCIDYRSLIAVSGRDLYPLKRLETCVHSLQDADVLLSLDSSNGFWQIDVDASAREKKTLVSHGSLCKFSFRLFSLENAPANFQIVIYIISSSCKWQFSLYTLTI